MRTVLPLGAAAAPAVLPWPSQGAVTGSRCDADMLGRYLRYRLRLLRRPPLLAALAGDACKAASAMQTHANTGCQHVVPAASTPACNACAHTDFLLPSMRLLLLLLLPAGVKLAHLFVSCASLLLASVAAVRLHLHSSPSAQQSGPRQCRCAP